MFLRKYFSSEPPDSKTSNLLSSSLRALPECGSCNIDFRAALTLLFKSGWRLLMSPAVSWGILSLYLATITQKARPGYKWMPYFLLWRSSPSWSLPYKISIGSYNHGFTPALILIRTDQHCSRATVFSDNYFLIGCLDRLDQSAQFHFCFRDRQCLHFAPQL